MPLQAPGSGIADRLAQRRLAICLLVALALHLLVFGTIGIRPAPLQRPAPPLILRWAVPPQASSAAAEIAAETGAPERQPARISASDFRGGRAASASPGAESAPPQGDANAWSLQPRGSAELIESARESARESSRDRPGHSPRSPVPEDRPILPGLDRALRKAGAGETRHADGLIRITAASGQVYCLRPPPDFARGGPVDMLSVPTTCP